jgi:hypothetical protein
VSEQGAVAIDLAGPRDYPVNPRTYLFGRLAARAPIAENHPARRDRVDLLGPSPGSQACARESPNPAIVCIWKTDSGTD